MRALPVTRVVPSAAPRRHRAARRGVVRLGLPLLALWLFACAGAPARDAEGAAGSASAGQGAVGGAGGSASGGAAGATTAGGAAGAAASAGAGGGGGGFSWAPSDVSVLYPPPAGPSDWARQLAPTAAGPRGALLPPAVWAASGEVLFESLSGYELLRLVSFRVDPCFQVGGKGACVPQLRIVWQPSNGGDAAVHTLYELGEAEFVEAVAALAALRAGHPEAEPAALAVNPVLRAEGAGGPYAAALEQLVLKYAGASNLVRMAVFSFPGSFPDMQGSQQWFFRAFDVGANGAVSRRPVAPTSTHQAQAFDTDAAHPRPAPGAPVGLRLLTDPAACDVTQSVGNDGDPELFGPSAAVCALPDALAAARVRGALRLENPLLTPSDSTSCANCHVAATTRLLTEARFGLDGAAFAERYGPEPDHQGGAFGYFGATRAFGFVTTPGGLAPAVSPRVAYETREVLRRLSELPGRPERAFAP